MPENRIQIEDGAGHRALVSSDGRFLTGLVPETYQFYLHSIFDVPGVVAANNFLSVFNPVGSGKNLIFFQAEIGSYASGASATATSMAVRRSTAASAGTLVSAANINRFITTQANPVAEVRTGNPTVTAPGVPFNSWAPPLSTGASSGATAYTSTPPSEGFFCFPGEGIVFSTASGNTNQLWKITVIWAEVTA